MQNIGDIVELSDKHFIIFALQFLLIIIEKDEKNKDKTIVIRTSLGF
jgi:hypothetical protein